MIDPTFRNSPPSATTQVERTETLYMWRGAGIVLLGEWQDGCLILSRGWHSGDRLEYVRRWTFRQTIPFSGQVRRLIMEATEDFATAREEGLRALAWAEIAA